MTNVAVKPVTHADASELIQSNIASRALHEPWVKPFTDANGFDEWFAGVSTSANFSLVARELHSGSIAGLITLSQIFHKNFQNAYLAYYGMIGFTRRGLMTQAVRLAVRYAFEEIGLHRLEANVQPANQPSIALLQRLGFRKEGFSPRYLRINGIWCDHERWALLSDDPT